MTARPARPPAPAFGGHSPSGIRLDPESVEEVARRVVELLRDGDEPGGLIDAAEVARRRGCSIDWVYRHADELGVVRQGGGERPRLRFDPVVACSAGRRSLGEESPANGEDRPGRPRARAGTNVELLPIGPRKGGRRAE